MVTSGNYTFMGRLRSKYHVLSKSTDISSLKSGTTVETYPEPCQTSKMKRFAKIVND